MHDFILQVVPSGSNKLVFETDEIYLCSSKGSRDTNEDRVVFALIENHKFSGTPLAVAALADGMGGMLDGEKAASLAISSFLLYLAAGVSESGLKELSKNAAHYADRQVYNVFRAKGGSTFSAIIYGRKGCVAINVGDSRIYLYDKLNGLKLLTIDDTISAQIHKNMESNHLVDIDFVDNRIIQYIGMGEGLTPHCLDLSEYFRNDNSEKAYLITSDGAHYLGKDILQRIIRISPEKDQITCRIVTTSEWLGGFDNSTAIYLPTKVNMNEFTKRKEIILKIYTIGKEVIFFIPTDINVPNAIYSPTNIDNKDKLFNESQSIKPRKRKKSSSAANIKKMRYNTKNDDNPSVIDLHNDAEKIQSKNKLTFEVITSEDKDDNSAQ